MFKKVAYDRSHEGSREPNWHLGQERTYTVPQAEVPVFFASRVQGLRRATLEGAGRARERKDGTKKHTML